VYDTDHRHPFDEPVASLPRFFMWPFIVVRKRWSVENRAGLLKADAVFREIRSVLLLIPFELMHSNARFKGLRPLRGLPLLRDCRRHVEFEQLLQSLSIVAEPPANI
jgi:hypothetical protein